MKYDPLALVLLLGSILTACVAIAPAPPTDTPLASAPPTTAPAQVAAGSYARMDFPPDARPTEASPQLTVRGAIVDKHTNEPLLGNVYVDERQLLSGVGEFELILPGRYEGWIRVVVPGYHDWKVRIRHQINHSKTMQAPVQMTPATEPLPDQEQLPSTA